MPPSTRSSEPVDTSRELPSVTATLVTRPTATVPDAPKFAKLPVFAVAGATMATLLIFSGRYGFHGDELYFVAAGHHWDWGYADQPPLLPTLAVLMDTLIPNSVVGLRVPAMLLMGLAVVVSGLIAREFGGRWKAQTMAAAAFASSPQLLAGSGHILATHMVDAVLWTVITWLVLRWARTYAQEKPNDRLLLYAGLVTALNLQAKFLIPFFWVVLVVAVLIVGPRDMLRRKMLWIGGAVAVLTTIPTLIWQATNGWPYLEMSQVVAQENSFSGGQAYFFENVLRMAGYAVGAAFLLWGVLQLLRSPAYKSYRFLGWTALGVPAVFLITDGRAYYVAGLFALLFGAAAADIERRFADGSWAWRAAIPIFVASAYFAVQGLPMTPLSVYADKPFHPMQLALEEYGWPEFVDDVSTAYLMMPTEHRQQTSVVTETYWHAAAIEQFGPERGLPDRAYGTGRGAWYFGEPPESLPNTLFVGWDKKHLLEYFDSVRLVSTVDNEHKVPNLTQGMPIWLCEGRKQPWSEIWPEARHMGFRSPTD